MSCFCDMHCSQTKYRACREFLFLLVPISPPVHFERIKNRKQLVFYRRTISEQFTSSLGGRQDVFWVPMCTRGCKNAVYHFIENLVVCIPFWCHLCLCYTLVCLGMAGRVFV